MYKSKEYFIYHNNIQSIIIDLDNDKNIYFNCNEEFFNAKLLDGKTFEECWNDIEIVEIM